MMSPCDQVTERIALGEPLADVEAHVATCPACSRLVSLPGLVAASAHAAEPNPGFAVRTAAGARQKLVTRRRRRIATNAVAALAAVALGIWAVQDPVDRPLMQRPAAMDLPSQPQPVSSSEDQAPEEIRVTDEDLGTELVRISDPDRVMRPSRQWREAEAPLAPYRFVVHQGARR